MAASSCLINYVLAIRNIALVKDGLGLIRSRLIHGDLNGEMIAIQQPLDSAWLMLTLVFAVSIVTLAIMSYVVFRSTIQPLRNLASVLTRMAGTMDFTATIPQETKGEVGQIVQACNSLFDRLRNSILGMQDSIGSMREVSEEVDHSSRQIAKNSKLQSDASFHMAAEVGKMTTSISTVAEQASIASNHTEESRALAEHSASVIINTRNAINDISESVQVAAGRIRSLQDNCDGISSVAEIIHEIANQTNLLALNAAIEAAHAKEHGLGFGVVADEVRKLAERTTQSTLEINELLNRMQESARLAVAGMERTEEAVGIGVGNAHQAGEAMEKLRAGAVASATVVAEISEAMRVQEAASSAIGKNIEQIANMSEQNSSAASAAATGVGRISQVGFEMADNLEAYKVDSGPKKLVLRFASPNAEDHPAVRAVRAMAGLLDQRTQGRITLKIFAGGAFGAEKETLEQVRAGTLDLARGNVALLSKDCPATIVPALPYLFDSLDHMHRVMEGPPGLEIMESCTQAGYVGLTVYDAGMRSIYSNQPIRSVADLHDMKLRILQSDLWVAIATAMGATPTPLAQDQVTVAAQTGLIDCAENSIVIFNGYKHYQAFKYFCATEHAMVPDILLFSKKRWDTLPVEDRAIIAESARESLPVMRNFFRESEKLANETAISAGTIFINDVDKASFRNAMRPVYDKFVVTPQQKALVKAILAMR
ncbi:MAG: TRAP transporter substrate-binding protein DctP [Holophaga sp.]|nr:TRAP transporter substrate-binding protein DctP [Holophaga sp.]